MLDGSQPASMTLFIDQNPQLFWFSHYNYFDTVRKLDFRLVDPYLDQPPAAMPIIGFFPKLFGFSDFREYPTGLVRIPSLLASALSLLLLWHVGKRFFGEKTALLATLIYAVTPYFVFAHREAFIENFLTPIYLGTLLLTDSYIRKKQTSVFLGLLILSGLAGLFKTIGFIVPLVAGFWLLKQKYYKETILVAGSLAVSVLLYWWWGSSIDASQFTTMLDLQATRGFSLNSVLKILTTPMFYEPFIDGWYIFSFIAFFGLLLFGTKNKKTSFVYISALFFFIPVLMTIGRDNNFPWYRYPLFPFLSLATAQTLQEVHKKIDLGRMLVFLLFAGSNLHLLLGDAHPLFYASITRISFVALLVPVGLFTLIKSTTIKKIAQLTFIIFFGFSLLINIAVIVRYPQSRCVNTHCMLPIKMIIDVN